LREDLESREAGARQRAKEQEDAEEKFRRELERLKAEGAGLRKKREEALRKVMEEDELSDEDINESSTNRPLSEEREVKMPNSRFTEEDRTVRVRWKNRSDAAKIDAERLQGIFERYGKITNCIVSEPGKAKDGTEKKLKTGVMV